LVSILEDHTSELPVYMTPSTFDRLNVVAPWFMSHSKVEIIVPDGSFDVMGVRVTPIPVFHGPLAIFGYRIGNLGYVTDASDFPELSISSPGWCDAGDYRRLTDRGTSDALLFVGVDAVNIIPRPKAFLWTHISHEVTPVMSREVAEKLRGEEASVPEVFDAAYDAMVLDFDV
jgi:phosphoribosyl 1,2-cyclic phosphodiesterase